jgi:hypothetical protein
MHQLEADAGIGAPMKTIVMFFAALIISESAHASALPATVIEYGSVLTSASLSGAAALRTVSEMSDGQWVRVQQQITVTVDDATDLDVVTTCSRTLDRTTAALSTWGSIPSASISAGVSTDTSFVRHHTYAQSATSTFTQDFDVWGYFGIKCVYSASGADSGDLITARWSAVVGK